MAERKPASLPRAPWMVSCWFGLVVWIPGSPPIESETKKKQANNQHINWVLATQMFIYVHPEPGGRWTQFDEHIFSDGWLKPPTSGCFEAGVFFCRGFTKFFVFIVADVTNQKGEFCCPITNSFFCWPPFWKGKWLLIVDFWPENFTLGEILISVWPIDHSKGWWFYIALPIRRINELLPKFEGTMG